MDEVDERWPAAAGAPETVPPQGDGRGGAEGGYAADGPVRPAAGPAGRSMPTWASVLIGDLAVALVALVSFVLIGLQRINDATLSQRRTAYTEDLLVFFGVGAVFLLVGLLLRRAGQARVALAQIVLAVVVLGLGGYAAATGNPKDNSVVSPIPSSEMPSTMNP